MYTAPSCSSDVATAQANFNNLKAYITEETTLLSTMGDGLSNLGIGAGSPARRYRDAYTSIANQETDVNTVTTTLDATMGLLKTNTTFSDAVDCRNLRAEFLKWEIDTCFKLNYYLYILLVIAAVMACVIFFLLWCICCALREMEGQVPNEPVSIKRS